MFSLKKNDTCIYKDENENKHIFVGTSKNKLPYNGKISFSKEVKTILDHVNGIYAFDEDKKMRFVHARVYFKKNELGVKSQRISNNKIEQVIYDDSSIFTICNGDFYSDIIAPFVKKGSCSGPGTYISGNFDQDGNLINGESHVINDDKSKWVYFYKDKELKYKNPYFIDKNGLKYVGTFKNLHGLYTEPTTYNGTWYNANGDVLYKVIKGKVKHTKQAKEVNKISNLQPKVFTSKSNSLRDQAKREGKIYLESHDMILTSDEFDYYANDDYYGIEPGDYKEVDDYSVGW